jgi:hypothetical protein
MKNLIEEIEKLRDLRLDGCLGDIVCRTCENETIDKVLKMLDQYNLITAPKSIKLSEMLDKICELYEEIIEQEIYFNREINCIGYGEYDEDWMQNSWHTFVAFNKDLTIKKINIRPQDNNIKWLYTLWIAGSEIIDDME